jgi:hypothetical protein
MSSINKSLTFSTSASNNNNPSNPTFFINPAVYNVEAYNITNFCGVNTTYTIDGRNSNFSFIENSITYNGFLPSGNYTLSTFIVALGSAMTTASGVSVYTVTNNALTNVLTITSNNKTFKLLDTVNNCYYEAGFSVSTVLGLTQTGSSSFDLSGLKQIRIVSSDLGRNAICVNSNYNVLACIDVSVPYLGVISHSGTNFFITANCNLNTMSFLLLDERNRILNNLKDWSITFILQTE